MNFELYSVGKSFRSRIYLVFLSLVGGFFLVLLPGVSSGQTSSFVIPPTTPLAIQLTQHVRMKTGEPLEGHLLYPVYAQDRIILPAGTILRGRVIRLDPDSSRRIRARLRGDFTPFHVPVVQFDQLILADGTIRKIVSDGATNGIPILRLSTPGGKKKDSLIAQQTAMAKERVKDSIHLVTAQGKKDRLVQWIYHQLPYHPERIESGTAWTAHFAEPLVLQARNLSPPAAIAPGGDKPGVGQPAISKSTATQAVSRTNTQNEDPKSGSAAFGPEWRLRAYLEQEISSAKNKPGDRFEAIVSEPVFDAHGLVLVPQGSLLTGEVTQAKPARSLSRQGKLRFAFRQLKLPGGFNQPVEGTLAGIDTNRSANLHVDSEGGIQPQSQSRVIVPMVLTILAGRAFDDDGNKVVDTAVASNGFGLVGRIVGIAASSRNLAAAIGFYDVGLAFYDRVLARGHDVVFVKNTRIEVNTTPTRTPLKLPGDIPGSATEQGPKTPANTPSLPSQPPAAFPTPSPNSPASPVNHAEPSSHN